MKLRDDPRRPARLVLPHGSASSTCTSRTRRSAAGSRSGWSSRYTKPPPRGAAAHPAPAQRRPRRSRRSCRPSTSARSGSRLEGGETADPAARRDPARPPPRPAWTRSSIGMAHRGRLNVLANIVGKPYEKIFREFEGHLDPKSVAGLRRRQVPPRHDRQVHHRRTASTPSTRRVVGEPVAPGGGRPGARGHRPGQAGPHRPQARGLHRCCRCWCTATRRSPARAWSPRR